MSLPLFCLTRASAKNFLPARAPPPLKKKAPPQQKKPNPDGGDVPAHLRRYRPHLPESLVAETVSFLRSSSKLRALLDLIFSPRDSRDSLRDREKMQQRIEEYHLQRQRHDLPFVLREAAAAASAWKALGFLPCDLHAEAVQSSNSAAAAAAAAAAAGGAEAVAAEQQQQGGSREETAAAGKETAGEDWEVYRQQRFPEELAFHRVYRQQIFDSLTPLEKHKLQVFQNLIHIRFTHSPLKSRQPELFWISARHAVGRQKEQALKTRKK